MSDALKPCAHCGGEAEIYNPFHLMGNPCAAATYRGGVRCKECGNTAKATTPPDKAIADWNRREPAGSAEPKSSCNYVGSCGCKTPCDLPKQSAGSLPISAGERELPPLPEPMPLIPLKAARDGLYTAEQMQDYARSAIAHTAPMTDDMRTKSLNAIQWFYRRAKPHYGTLQFAEEVIAVLAAQQEGKK